ncbi:type II secretion system protein [Candidatus Gribaldobacteria bacterium]|nr:type II secretion system protein [Candidatus Gribaldobacteria bacterium]
MRQKQNSPGFTPLEVKRKTFKKGPNSKLLTGFTLIELLVVIAIMGLLASVVLVTFPNAQKSARDVERKAVISQIRKALEVYYEINGFYPLSGGAVSPNSGWSNSADASWDILETSLTQAGVSLRDPLNDAQGSWASSGKYVFNYYSRGYGCNQKWYMLVYNLENKNDPELLNSPGVTACNGQYFKYRGTITIGMCRGCQ